MACTSSRSAPGSQTPRTSHLLPKTPLGRRDHSGQPSTQAWGCWPASAHMTGRCLHTRVCVCRPACTYTCMSEHMCAYPVFLTPRAWSLPPSSRMGHSSCAIGRNQSVVGWPSDQWGPPYQPSLPTPQALARGSLWAEGIDHCGLQGSSACTPAPPYPCSVPWAPRTTGPPQPGHTRPWTCPRPPARLGLSVPFLWQLRTLNLGPSGRPRRRPGAPHPPPSPG